uniref:Cytochrome c oxidase assembly protein COX20, mitochondrial n=2 Tax=Clytia hemisphaerica TaxID=252671 RepID=A0A7M5X6Y8_9CNID
MASEDDHADENQENLKCQLKESNQKHVEKKKWNMKEFVQKTPGVRSSLINGIVGGSSFGIGTFLFTKRIKRSCDVAVGGFLTFSLISWGYCSYHRMEQAKNLQNIIQTMENTNKRNRNKIEELKAQKVALPDQSD